MFSMFFRWVAIVVCLVAVETQTVAGEYGRQRDGAGCEPGWSPLGDVNGELSSQVYALAVFDDGNGEALIAATIAGIQRWDGEAWTVLGTPSSIVNELIVHDDGSGEALYAAGNFTSVSGVPANRVAKWNGTEWSALGEGLDAQAAALAVFDDGSGSALYVGGQFSSAGGVTARRVARWDGSDWNGVDNGISDDFLNVLSLGVYDDGSGPALYAGVGPGVPNSPSASRILRLSSGEWVEIGMIPYTMLNTGFPFVLHAHDDGSGEALYLGGVFAGVDGVPGTTGFARWDGTAWSAVGGDFFGQIYAVLSVPSESGSVLYVGGGPFTVDGELVGGVARWDGANWSALPELTGNNMQARAMVVHDDGSGHGQELYVGGLFTSADWIEGTRNIARWSDDAWSPLGPGINGRIDTMVMFDDGLGDGEVLYAVGQFTHAGRTRLNQIARWDGGSWQDLDGGVDHPYLPPGVYAMEVADLDGQGDALYVGGRFDSAGGVAVSNLARWDGVGWSDVGGGATAATGSAGIFALRGGRDSAKELLFVGGWFDQAGSIPASGIAAWDGQSWASLGDGVSGSSGASVTTIEFHDSGEETALYVGGYFDTAGTAPAANIAVWVGINWMGLGDGMSESVSALRVFDDGQGAMLYAGGFFETAGGVEAAGLARWDGLSWQSVWSQVVDDGWFGGVYCLEVFDDGQGDGPALYVGGEFRFVNGQDVWHIARWDGVQWSELSGGVSGGIVRTMTATPAGSESAPGLFVGGSFQIVDGEPSPYLAKWIGCDLEVPCPGDVTGNGAVGLDDFIVLAANFGSGPGITREQGDLNGDGFVDLADFNILAVHFGTQCR